jgi:hypothetical protein
MNRESLIKQHGRPAVRRSGQARRAVMLVEVMVAVALVTIVMGIVISLLVSLRQWDRRLRDGNARAAHSLRLAQSMRNDIRQGTYVALPTKDTIVITSAGNVQTRYELTADGCQRTVGAMDQPAASHELFSIGKAASWSLEHGSPGRRAMIIVSLDHVDPQNRRQSRPAPLVVYAAVGADQRPTVPAAGESTSPTP